MRTSRTAISNTLKVRLGLALLGLVFAAMLPAIWYVTKASPLLPIAGIGGPFSLVDQHGKQVTDKDFLGNPTLVFFGFTHCPDVCPTTLYEMSNRLKELGREGDRLNILFVSVDPQRDTPEQLALYLSSFDPRIVGLSGSEENVSTAMRGYRIYARKVPLPEGDYTMDHTATIFMMNRSGQLVKTMNYQDKDSEMRSKIRLLLDSN